MSTEPASVLHRFVSLANEPDYTCTRLDARATPQAACPKLRGVADLALHQLPARRAALGRGVRRLVAPLRAVADPQERHGVRPQ